MHVRGSRGTKDQRKRIGLFVGGVILTLFIPGKKEKYGNSCHEGLSDKRQQNKYTACFVDQVCYFCISYLRLGTLMQIPENRTVAFSLPQPM